MKENRSIRKIPSFRRNVLQRKTPLSWRKPKGLFNKRKDGRNSKGKTVKIGYKQHLDYRFKVPEIILKEGKPISYKSKELKVVATISNPSQIENIIVKDKECIIISGRVGKRKRLKILQSCKSRGIPILPSQLYQLDKK